MDRRPTPLVLTYSTRPVADPDRAVSIHLDAARRIGLPMLMQGGWAGFTGAGAEDLIFGALCRKTGFFEKAGCVIHHGGIGTVARALRNGCPMLVEPHSHDQFFNALLVLKGGFGAAINPVRMGSRTLTRLLEEKVLTPETKRNAAAAALLLQEENGLDTAVKHIEGCYGERPSHEGV
jgi:UDP:flavonoid glycosyltransferase YjiC (YdhE family)